MFLFFLLYILNLENKRVGLVIYYFFQRIISLFLFLRIFLSLNKIVFLILCAKLGLFPFFYWIIIVRLKIGYVGNIFVLVLQKIPVFWLIWLIYRSFLILLLILVYLRIFFVLVNLLLIIDLWLLLIYSSIANTGLLIISIYGNFYFNSIFIYLIIVLVIIYLIKRLDSYNHILIIVLLFMVVPPFVLFFIKIYIVISISFSIKLILFIFFLDVFILFYYFTLIFLKFFLIERRVLIYFINLIILIRVIFFRNCVTLIIFYKS